MSAPLVVVEDRDRLRHVHLNRPDKINALNAAMMRAIADAVAHADPGRTDLVVLSGEGPRGFCAGADIAEFAQGAAALETQEHALVDMIEAFAGTPLPVAVLAHGRALGAGGTLMTLADLVIASDDLSFGFPEIRFGMYPVIVHGARMYKLSEAQSAQLCLSGRTLGAQEAMTLGLVTRVVQRATFDTDARDALRFFAERAVALKIGKRAWRQGQAGATLGARVRALAPLMLENFAHPDVQARIATALGPARG